MLIGLVPAMFMRAAQDNRGQTPAAHGTAVGPDLKPGAGSGHLRHIGSVTRDDLQGVVGLASSPDGMYLYAAAFHGGTVTVFTRDPRTGELTHVQTLQNRKDLSGVTSITVSSDGQYAATAAFQSGAAVLYARDGETGRLTRLHALHSNDEGVEGLDFAIRARFSPEGRHLYVLDGEDGGLTTLEIQTGGRLKWLQTNKGEDSVLGGSRGLAFLAGGGGVLAANYRGNSLVLFDRNRADGTTSVRQVLKDEENGIRALAGAFGVAVSADGKFVYVCSGRFQGDNAVSVFTFDASGKLVLAQELVAGEDGFQPFAGGNHILVSPDGRNVYAVATASGSLACFERDPAKGKLRLLEVLTNSSGAGALGGAAGIECSPDGHFLYVAAEFEQTISVYRRLSAPSS